MRRLWNTFLKGLAAVLPVALTIYLVYWLAKTAESILGGPLRWVLPSDRYWPGLPRFSLPLFPHQATPARHCSCRRPSRVR